MNKIHILFTFIFSLWVSVCMFNVKSFAESQSGKDMSANGAALLIFSPLSPLITPTAVTGYLTCEKQNPADSKTVSALLPAETVGGALIAPGVAAYGAGQMLAGLSQLPFDSIKKQSELQKKDILQIPLKAGQPSANLQLQGQSKQVQIPLEVNPHPIQLNQKLEDPQDRIPSEVTTDFIHPRIKILLKQE